MSPSATDTGRFWHPFSDMSKVSGHEFVIDRAQDVWLWDRDGTRYLDATSSLWYANIGHGRPRMAEAIAAQIRKLDAYSTFGDQANEPAITLSERLAALSPLDDARVFLTTGGGDSIETAAKLARLHFAVTGQEQRTHVIGRAEGFHGVFGFGTSIGGIDMNRAGFGPLVSDVSHVAHDSVEALEEELRRVGPDRVAAFFCEPVMGAGGVLLPGERYIEGVAALCERHGVLFVCDSVICGFGRLGTWFGIERFDATPDMITFAKGVTSGYLPLGGVMVSGAVAEPLWNEPTARPFRQGTTYAGHPTCCAAALTNLDILEEERLLARSLELEGQLAEVLDAAARDALDAGTVSEVRAGCGLLGAVEVAPELLAAEPGLVARLGLAVRARGVMVRPLGSAIAVSPPLVCTREHLDLIGEAIAGALAETLTPAMAERTAG
jgi:adenosylmethionine-8-amino-7-oxononanoate aminotransferase